MVDNLRTATTTSEINGIRRYNVYNTGPVDGSPGHFNTHYNFRSIPDNDFGHWTNNKVSYTRYYDGSDALSDINNPVHDIVVLSLFFALYERTYDYPGGRVPRTHPNTNLGNFNIGSVNDRLVIQDTAGSFKINTGLDLLFAREDKTGNLQYSATRIRAIQDNFSKYLCAQMYYSFINQYYDETNTRGIRIYFDSYSMNLFKTCDIRLTLDLPWEYILQHIDAADNRAIYTRWNEIDLRFRRYFATEITAGKIQLETTRRALDIRSINYNIEGLPIVLHVNDYRIHIASDCTPEQRHILLIKIYMFFSCGSSDERWNMRNRVFQYFEYHLHHSLLTNYSITVNTVPSRFLYAKTQGYIGQYIRYLSLGQQNVPGGLPRPKVIYIRDAHHAIPTRRELAVMAAFKRMPTKRYFWAVGPTNATNYHQPPLAAFDMTNIGQSTGTPPNTLRSCWAGLQTFKQLDDTDTSVFASNRLDFIRTLGLLLLLDVGNPEHVRMCDYIFGIRYPNNSRNDPVATYYLYGVDERMVTNCFYSVVEVDEMPAGQYTIRYSTDEEKRNSLMWQEAIQNTSGRRTLNSFNKANHTFTAGENWRKKLMVNSIFYTFTLDTDNVHAVNNKFDLGDAKEPYRTVENAQRRQQVDIQRYDPNPIMNEAIGEYIRDTGSYPKSAGDFLRFVEGEKDHNLKEPLQISKYSLYHACSLLFSSFNLIENPNVGLRPWFNKTFIAENPTRASPTGDIIYRERSRANMLALFQTPVAQKDNAFHQTINFIHNISHHNKRSVLPDTLPDANNTATWMRPRNPHNILMCYGDIRDSSNLDPVRSNQPGISNNSCLTHPLDLEPAIVPRVATPGITNIRRGGLSFDPATEIRSIEVQGRAAAQGVPAVNAITNPYQMGGTNNTPKKLNANVNNVNNHKMISNKDDYQNFIWALTNNRYVSFKEIDEKSRVSINKILKDAMSSDIFIKIKLHWIDTHPDLNNTNEEYIPAYDIYNPDAEVLKRIDDFSGQFKTYITYMNTSDEELFFDIFFKGISNPIPTLESILTSSLNIFLSNNTKNTPINSYKINKKNLTPIKIKNVINKNPPSNIKDVKANNDSLYNTQIKAQNDKNSLFNIKINTVINKNSPSNTQIKAKNNKTTMKKSRINIFIKNKKTTRKLKEHADIVS